MKSLLLLVAGSASANTCSGETLCGLQSRVTSRSWSGRVATCPASGAISPREQKFGVHALGWQVFPLSGSVNGGTGLGEGHVCAVSETPAFAPTWEGGDGAARVEQPRLAPKAINPNDATIVFFTSMTAEHIAITLALLIQRGRRIAPSSKWRHARADPLRRVCSGDSEATNAVRLRYKKRTTGVLSAASNQGGRPCVNASLRCIW